MAGPHLEITIDRAARLVRARRTDAPIASAADVADMVTQARAALAGVARAELALLIDLRAATLADESTHATEMASLRRELCRGFWRVAMLVETSTGLLQVQRFIRLEKLSASGFDSEVKALVFLDHKGRTPVPSGR